MLTAIQTFPLDDLHQSAFGEASKEYPVIVSADISSKLGWNLHVEPLRNREKARIRTPAGSTKRPAVKPARSVRFSYHEDPAWKMLLADTNRFVDAIDKQLKPTNSTNGVSSQLELAVINGLTNASDVSSPENRVHTPTVTPSCQKGTSRSVVEGSRVRVVPDDVAAFARGPGRAIPSAVSKRLLLNASPLASDNGSASALASRVPLNQSRVYGYKVLAAEPSVGSKSAGNTFSGQSSSVIASTAPKRPRLLRGRPATIKLTATTRLSKFPGATRTSETRTGHDSAHRVDAATKRDDGAILGQGSSNSSKPRRMRRRKKRPKINLFQPRQRKLAADVKWPRRSKCRTVGARRRTCEPDQRRLEDHMTDSSVVRPRVYGLEPVVGSEEREQQTRQPAVKRTRQVHRPPEEPTSRESREDYYDYSPEYHAEEDYHHDSYPEDVSDEDSQELGRRESNLASPDAPAQKGGLPKIDASSTLEKAAANDVGSDYESITGTDRLNYSDASKDAVDPANQSASSRALNDTVEGFTLLIESDGELASVGLRRDPPNSTNVERGPSRDSDEMKLLHTDPTPAAASELAAMSGVQLIRDADIIHGGAHSTSSDRREDTGASKFFR